MTEEKEIDNRLHAIGYCRVSTDDKGQDPEIQAKEIQKWCESNNIALDRIYLEECSGMQWPRDELSKALVSVRTGKASVLICYDQSRLTRNAKEHMPLINGLIGEGKIIRFVTNGDQDPSSFGVRIINAIKNETDNEERRVLGEKTKLALVYRRDVLHKHVGRPARLVITDDVSMFPEGKICKTTIILSPKDVLRYADSGWSPNYVAKRILKVPAMTFYRALESAELMDEYNKKLGEHYGCQTC